VTALRIAGYGVLILAVWLAVGAAVAGIFHLLVTRWPPR
jgi:hypothetical protein